MKIRTDFVTNSSSSSFIAVGIMNAELAEYVTILLNGENTGYAKNLIGCLNVNGSIVSVSAENQFVSLHIDFTDAGVDSRNDREKREDEKRVNTTQVICEMLRACLPGSTDEDECLFRSIVSSCVANHQTIAEVYNSETDEPYFETFTEWSFRAKHINDSGSSFGNDPLKHLKEVFPSWKAGIPFDHVATIVCEGKKFHLTGTSDEMFEYLRIRKSFGIYSAKSWVQAKKGIISETVTRACDYLIVGTRATVDSPQVAKAIQYRNSGKSNIKIIPEDELLRMLNGEVLEISEEDQRAMQAREDAIQHAADETLRLQQEAARRVDKEKRAAREDRARQREQAKAALEEYRKERREARQAASQQRQEAAAAAKEEKSRLAAEERDRKIADEVLYRPGEEPEILQARISVLFEQLDAAYPDKQISSLQAQHKKLSEKANEIRKQLGYPDSQAFLEAYGYTIANSQGGRPSTVNPDAVIEELKRRYPHGGYSSVAKLMAANSDLPLKTLKNNAQKLFGMSLGDYLKEIGVLS